MAMTAERRTFIELKDIVAFEIRCKTCQTQVRHQIDKLQLDRFTARMVCPNCNADLLHRADEGAELHRFAEFIDALRRMVQTESRAQMRLEVICEPE